MMETIAMAPVRGGCTEDEVACTAESSPLHGGDALQLYCQQIDENIAALKVHLIVCEKILNLRKDLLSDLYAAIDSAGYISI